MAVFTQLQNADLQYLHHAYGLHLPIRASGIDGGIENSNFFITAGNAPSPGWVLTLVESDPDRSLAVARLQARLAQAGLPVPEPQVNALGCLAGSIQNRPALLYPLIRGQHVRNPDGGHCRAIGAFLAQLHRLPWPDGVALPGQQDPGWFRATAAVVCEQLSPREQQLLREELAFQENWPWGTTAAQTICHGDLFHDNVLFEGARLKGVIDWHNVGADYGLFDLAVACSDWCRIPGATIDPARMQALIDGYSAGCGAPAGELAPALQPFLRRAALRFWLSRLQRKAEPAQANARVQFKDPAEYGLLLEDLQQHGSPLQREKV